MRFTCTICRRFAYPNLQGVIRHIGSVHSHEPDFKVTCGIGGCPRTYLNFRSFQKHIRRVHVTVLEEDEANSLADPPQSNTGDVNLGPGTRETRISLKRNAALFLLKTKEKGWVSQATLDELVSDLTSFFQDRLSEVQQEVKCIIQRGVVHVPNDVIAAIERSFKKEEISRPFHGLESEYFQKKYFKEELNMMVRSWPISYRWIIIMTSSWCCEMWTT